MVTGGGTGGHVYPAIEVSRALVEDGHSVRYLGSLRGQESAASERVGIAFQGFASEPLTSLRTLRGLRAAVRLLQAQAAATRYLRLHRPRVVFSTGGYASAPIVAAARRLGIPYVLHEQNSVPGRTNRMLSRKAFVVATVFHSSADHFPGVRVVRTGMPVRREIRTAAREVADPPLVLVMGGSQGAVAINDAALASSEVPGLQWLHVTGPAHFESVSKAAPGEHYRAVSFMQVDEMARALAESSVAFCRSGAGTISELAARRVPSVLVPYPHAFGDHQRHNARKIVSLGGAVMIEQSELSQDALAEALVRVLEDRFRVVAESALAGWDVPDATAQLIRLIEDAR